MKSIAMCITNRHESYYSILLFRHVTVLFFHIEMEPIKLKKKIVLLHLLVCTRTFYSYLHSYPSAHKLFYYARKIIMGVDWCFVLSTLFIWLHLMMWFCWNSNGIMLVSWLLRFIKNAKNTCIDYDRFDTLSWSIVWKMRTESL